LPPHLLVALPAALAEPALKEAIEILQGFTEAPEPAQQSSLPR
jgi:hypothetical protein